MAILYRPFLPSFIFHYTKAHSDNCTPTLFFFKHSWHTFLKPTNRHQPTSSTLLLPSSTTLALPTLRLLVRLNGAHSVFQFTTVIFCHFNLHCLPSNPTRVAPAFLLFFFFQLTRPLTDGLTVPDFTLTD